MLQIISSKARALIQAAGLQTVALTILTDTRFASSVTSTRPHLVNPLNMLIARELGWRPRYSKESSRRSTPAS